MALTQMDMIQSLGEAMAWLQRELEWGVPPRAQTHLCGRIGELYASLITNGQLALEVNQKGYDVVGSDGQRISVKTTAMDSGGHFSFNPSTLKLVDRIILLRINTEEGEIETLLDAPIKDAEKLMRKESDRKLTIAHCKLIKKPKKNIKTVRKANIGKTIVRELESGTIEVEVNGVSVVPAKPELRRLCNELSLPIVNANGNAFNTRQLGSQIIRAKTKEDAE